MKRYRKICLLGLLALFIIAGCDNKIKSNEVDNEEIVIKYTEEGIIEPAIAKKLIEEISKDVIKAIGDKDVELLATYVHPIKGVRFSPYTYISTDKDIILYQDDMKGFFLDKEEYHWGVYDGIGDDIRLTPSEYYEEFIYPVDYLNAEQIGYNEILGKGNMISNQFEVYKDAIVVEYYFSGFKEEYGGVDWKSLRLVFEEYEESWLLVGIIHNQWTV